MKISTSITWLHDARKPVNTTTRTALFLTLVYVLVIFVPRDKTRAVLAAKREAPTIRYSHRHYLLKSNWLLNVVAASSEFDAAVTRSDKARVPYTIGALRPLILLPTALLFGR